MKTHLALAVLPFALGAAYAQQTTATFYAIVTDSSGATTPAASVTITHEGTGIALSAAQNVRQTFVLEAGAATGTVSVQAAAPPNMAAEGVRMTRRAATRRTTCSRT